MLVLRKENIMSECFYCEDGEKRKSLMIEICRLKVFNRIFKPQSEIPWQMCSQIK